MAGAPISITPYGNPVNSGTSDSLVQWENSHVSIRFPLDDNASVVSTDGRKLPMDFLVDLSVFTDSSPLSVKLMSAYVGPGLISMSLADDKGPLCVCSVPISEYEQYAPVRMDGVQGRNASGVCSFGVDPSAYDQPTLLRFNPGIRIAVAACHHVGLGRLTRFVDEVSGQSVSGNVTMELGPGLSAFLFPSEVSSGEDKMSFPCARIFMDSELGGNMVSPCIKKHEDELMDETPISSINGIAPDCDGKFAIVFE